MDMQGWDVIYATNISKINEVLAASASSLLPTFSFENDTLQLKFSGTFGPWSIDPGGSANRINLKVPIKQGTLSFPAFGTTPLSLDGAAPIMNVSLSFEKAHDSDDRNVKFDITTNSVKPSDKSGDIYVNNPDATGVLAQRDPTGQANALIRDWFGELFVQNQAKISFVFATVFAQPTGMPFLYPKATSLTYFESQSDSIEALAIKTLTESPWSADGLATAVDPSLLVQGEDMFFALSQGVFMKNLLLPATAKALNTDSGNLCFNGPSLPNEQGNCSITNKTTISLPAVENAGTHYYPKLTTFKVVISGNQIITSGSGQFDITGLANAYVTFDNLQVINEITYNSTTKKIGFTLVSKTQPSTNKHIPWYDSTITWIVPVVGLIVNLVENIVVATIENSVENALNGTGSLSSSTIELSTAIWTGLQHFDVNQADLSTALVIRGLNS